LSSTHGGFQVEKEQRKETVTISATAFLNIDANSDSWRLISNVPGNLMKQFCNSAKVGGGAMTLITYIDSVVFCNSFEFTFDEVVARFLDGTAGSTLLGAKANDQFKVCKTMDSPFVRKLLIYFPEIRSARSARTYCMEIANAMKDVLCSECEKEVEQVNDGGEVACDKCQCWFHVR
jgi:hypothetical protein